MKYMLVALLSLFASLPVSLATDWETAEAHSGFQYSGHVDQDGSYHVEIVETYPKEVSLHDIFAKGFLNPQLQKSLSPMLADVKYDLDITSALSPD